MRSACCSTSPFIYPLGVIPSRWQGGVFKLEVKFPTDYPYKPPRCAFRYAQGRSLRFACSHAASREAPLLRQHQGVPPQHQRQRGHLPRHLEDTVEPGTSSVRTAARPTACAWWHGSTCAIVRVCVCCGGRP
jgi:hypothetical protein